MSEIIDLTKYKPVDTCPGYLVSKEGNIYSTKINRLVTGSKEHDGSLKIDVRYPDGSRKAYYAHLLAAEAFLPNPNHQSKVTHIDGDKSNNNITNLKWVGVPNSVGKYLEGWSGLDLDSMSDIPGYPNHLINRSGDVYSINNKRLLRICRDKPGYAIVSLTIGDRSISRRVHRLLAITYLPNPNNLPQINHIDGNKRNNSLHNLEWSTSEHNINHAFDKRLNSKAVRCSLLDITTNKYTCYRSFEKLSKIIGVRSSVIRPYVKNSEKYPIMNRYVITINESDLDNLNKTLPKSTTMYAYDLINRYMYTYYNLALLEYYTGIRNMSKTGDIFVNSYLVSVDKNIILNKLDSYGNYTKEELEIIRNNYLSRSYARLDNSVYWTLDYGSGVETKHKDWTSVANYINKYNNVTINNPTLYSAINQAKIQGHTGLLLGVGIAMSPPNISPDWHHYSEERMYNNKRGLRYNRPQYIANINSKDSEVMDLVRLMRYLDPYIPKNHTIRNSPVYTITANKINGALKTNKHIKVRRLNH